ncbi:efflux RND transporter periplasmic adaptor subunit [Hymenobacter glacialis]|uniref:Efflux transporter periplasmic adaptor subunit n=1 Tax=Hymenobacter glacialis TaxID=1908236 RepID=A0A1G1T2K7_9BACT|nr:efflux RND transporter periplasmic adaptor subunit [Hymenobacter glacialis]OGX85098.1 efflux transporter periplasmic adaptor subunit [Hymenobacter glacialis]
MKSISLCSLLPLALLFAACSNTQPEAAPAPLTFVLSDTILRQLELDTVRLESVRSELTLSGLINSNGDRTARVYPLVGGVVEDLRVELGDRVTKGQVLAVIRSGEIADLQNQSSAAATDLAIARKNLQVLEDQFGAGLASEREVVLARKELEKAVGNTGKSRKQLGIYGVTSDGKYTIQAPISGFITEKNVTENMQYNDSNVDNFFTIADLDDVWIMANVFESDISKVKEGYAAEVTTLSYPNEHFMGKIDKVFNVLDPESRVMKVRIRLPNPGYRLKPQMYAQVRVRHTEAQQLLAVPARCVIFDKNRHFVLVYKDRRHVQTREVELANTVGEVSYVQSGLRAGERIITRNQLLVYDQLND